MLLDKMLQLTGFIFISVPLILLLRQTLLRHSPRKWVLFLWGLVLFQFCWVNRFTFSLPLPFKFHQSLQQVPLLTPYLEPIQSETLPIQTNSVSLIQLLHGVLLIGMIVFFLYHLVMKVLRFSHNQKNQIIPSDSLLLKLKQMKLPTRCSYDRRITTAAVTGILYPRLILGHHFGSLSETEQDCILLHEAIHYRHHHLWIQEFCEWIRILYWYQPLVHVMISMIYQDLEVICDEEVVKTSSARLKQYAELLITLPQKKVATVLSAQGQYHQLQHRIQYLLMKAQGKIKVRSSFLILSFMIVLMMVPKVQLKAQLDVSKLESMNVHDFVSTMQLPIEHIHITCGTGCYSGHYAIDMQNQKDLYGEVKAIHDATVLETGTSEESGNYVVLAHGSHFQSRYQHLKDILVQQGQTLHQGDVLGHIGTTGRTTGPHLHFEVWFDGQYVQTDEFIKENSYE